MGVVVGGDALSASRLSGSTKQALLFECFFCVDVRCNTPTSHYPTVRVASSEYAADTMEHAVREQSRSHTSVNTSGRKRRTQPTTKIFGAFERLSRLVHVYVDL